MKSRVYFISLKSSDSFQIINQKLKSLLDESKVLDFIRKEYKVAVKVHFGEEGNTGFVRPEHVRVICDGIADKGAAAFLIGCKYALSRQAFKLRGPLAACP